MTYPTRLPRIVPGEPPEVVVLDRPTRCPYLSGREARLPLRLPSRRLRRAEVDQRFAQGDRRQGLLLYRPACAGCDACEPVRVDARDFRPSRSQRRALRVGDRELEVEVGPAVTDEQRVRLYNAHSDGRGLSDGPPIDAAGYEEFLVQSCCETFEIRYLHRGRLVGVAICDRGERSLSAVYCHHDPEFAHLGIGTYSVLTELRLCRELGLRWLYLGLYVRGCDVMAYKARFRPQERLLAGTWVREP